MATYETDGRGHIIYPIGTNGFPIITPRQAARTYANGDIIRGPYLERDLKICDAIAAGEELDSNASPTATGKLRVTDGTTTVDVIAVTATQLGTAGWVARLTEQAALGYVIPSRGFWMEFVFDAAFATAASGIITFGLTVSTNMFGDSVLAPTGG